MYISKRWIMVGTSLTLASLVLVLAIGLVSAGSGTWTSMSGPVIGGRGNARALATHPVTPNLALAYVEPYAGAPPHLIYRTTDGGAGWTQVYTADTEIVDLALGGARAYAVARASSTDTTVLYRSPDSGLNWSSGLTAPNGLLRLFEVEIDPNDADLVYVGGGNGADEAVVYSSTNGFATGWAGASKVFTFTNLGGFPSVNALLIHPTTPQTMLLSYDGPTPGDYDSYIARSTNGGVSWTVVYTIADDLLGDFLVDPTDPLTIYAATLWRQDIYSSTNGGGDWNKQAGDTGVANLELGEAGRLWGAAEGRTTRTSTDHGATWDRVQYAPGGASGVLAVDRNQSPPLVYFGSRRVGPMTTTNNSLTQLFWASNGISTTMGPINIKASPFVEGLVMVGDGEIQGYKSGSWEEIPLCYMDDFAFHPSVSGTVYAGGKCDTCAILYKSLNNGGSWTSVFTHGNTTNGHGDIRGLVVHPVTPTIVVGVGNEDPGSGPQWRIIVRSADGINFSYVYTDAIQGEFGDIAMSTASTNTMYVATARYSSSDNGQIWRSTDSGQNWTPVYTGETGRMQAVEVDRNPDVVYALDEDGNIWRSQSGGDVGAWTQIYTASRFAREAGAILADPLGPGVVYRGESGRSSGDGKVYVSRDYGDTWTELSGWNGDIASSIVALGTDGRTPTQTLYAGSNGVWAYTKQAEATIIYIPIILKNTSS